MANLNNDGLFQRIESMKAAELTKEHKCARLALALPHIVRRNTRASGYADDNPCWEWCDGETWHQCLYNDPLSDLNAMRKAEKVLTQAQAGDYDSTLWLVLKREWDAKNDPCAIIASWHATAAQRADAIGKTLNLW